MTQFTNIIIKYENQDIIVIDKPAGLVVHPGAAKEKETVASWLLEKYPDISTMSWPDASRPGIVHRLDKDTSGLMILAKNPEALEKMQKLFQTHKIKKSYLALIYGKLEKTEGEIAGFISRDPNARRKQTAKSIHFDFQPGKAREAKTDYKVIKEYHFKNETLTLVEAKIETGRMHQIRVHFKSIGHPVIGDPVYNTKPSRRISKKLDISRQFLHAFKLQFGNQLFESYIPEDLKKTLQKIS